MSGRSVQVSYRDARMPDTPQIIVVQVDESTWRRIGQADHSADGAGTGDA